MGKASEAVPLFREELKDMRERHGAEHEETIGSARNLRNVLLELGDQNGAAALDAEFELLS